MGAGEMDAQIIRAITGQIETDETVNLCNRLSFSELMALYQHCRFFVGVTVVPCIWLLQAVLRCLPCSGQVMRRFGLRWVSTAIFCAGPCAVPRIVTPFTVDWITVAWHPYSLRR